MNKEIITNKQGISIIVLFIIGSAIVLSPGSEAGQDVWLALLFALLMAFCIINVYARLLSIFPGYDLFDILHQVLGKWLGKIVGLMFVWYAFHLGSIVIRNFTEFIQIISLPDTPQFIIALIVGVLCIWFVKAGLEVFGRWAGFVLPFAIVIIASIISLSLTEVDFNNIKPILYNGFGPVIKNAYSVLVFPFAETVILMMVFCSAKNKFNVFKVYNFGLSIGFILLFVAAVRDVLVLGETGSFLFFPAFSAVSLVNLANFLQRIEIIIAVIFLLAGIIKIGACLYAATNGITKIFNFNNKRQIVAPIGLLMVNLSCIIYDNTMEMFEWATKIYPFYAIPFQIILPIIILIVAEIKVHLAKPNKMT